MKTKYIQFLKGCIALIITLSGLYMGQSVWQNYAVDLPLDKALNGISGIEKVTWDESHKIKDEIVINVTLGDTANLQKTYAEINEKIKDSIKNKEYILNIQDNRTNELEQSYYEIHYHIQKSIIDGDFPALESKVKDKAEAIGANAKLYVDEQNIYLELTKENRHLYTIVARNSNRMGGNFQ